MGCSASSRRTQLAGALIVLVDNQSVDDAIAEYFVAPKAIAVAALPKASR